MDHVIASAGLRFRYLCDPSSIHDLDAQKILDDLCEPESRYALCGWFARVSLSDFDHVVLATDRETGRHIAMLVANNGTTAKEAYLDLRAAFVIDAMRGSKLMRGLLAYTISRISCLGEMPRVIVAQTSIPACYCLLSLFSRNIPGATVFPEPKTAVVDLGRAGLARQIARHAVPNLEYEAGTGTIKAARLMNATCFARTSGADPLVDAMFERNLGSSDQMMVVVDMRHCDEATIDAKTTKLVRSRWKIPFLPTPGPLPPTGARVSRHRRRNVAVQRCGPSRAFQP
jgi:hypothetical protein